MTVVQVWLLIGIPVLVGAIALYTARSPALGALGVLLTLGAAAGVATVDQASGMVLGIAGVLLYASGRAGHGAAVGDDPVRPAGSSHRDRPPSADDASAGAAT